MVPFVSCQHFAIVPDICISEVVSVVHKSSKIKLQFKRILTTLSEDYGILLTGVIRATFRAPVFL